MFKDYMNTVKPVLRGHLWDKEKLKKDRWKKGSVEINMAMTGHEKGDLSIQVTA